MKLFFYGLMLLMLLQFPIDATAQSSDEKLEKERVVFYTKKFKKIQKEKQALLQKAKELEIEISELFFIEISENTTSDELKICIFKLRKQIKAINDLLEQPAREKIVREIEKQTARVRGLRIKQPVNFDYLSKDDLSSFLDQIIDAQLPPEKFSQYEFTLKHFGIVKPDVDLKRLIIKMLSDQIGGLYDEQTGKLYVMEQFDLSKILSKIILAHEICHALQDQHYNLKEWPLKEKDNDDLAIAASCVLEGDATILMGEWTVRHGEFSLGMLKDAPGLLWMNQKTMSYAPPVLIEQLTFPYNEGMKFMQACKFSSDIRYEDVFKNPPQSTEQVIHPEKYLYDIDVPTFIRLKDYSKKLGKKWTHSYTNVFGEAGIQIWMKSKIGSIIANRAAAGWDGDRFDIYRQGEEYLFVWTSIWDTEKDAREFKDAYLQARKLDSDKYKAQEIKLYDNKVLVLETSTPATIKKFIKASAKEIIRLHLYQETKQNSKRTIF